MKICKFCKIEKSVGQFSKNKRMHDGLQQRCKVCCKKYYDDNFIKKDKIDYNNIKELICTKCNLIKSIKSFSKRNNNPRRFSYWCKSCISIYTKNIYHNNIDEKRKKNNSARHKDIEWLRSLKNSPCVDCDIKHEPQCMDFDHVPERGKKIKNVIRMVLDHAPKQTILDEIKKCDIVCLLCHNKRTKKRLDDKFGPTKAKPHQQRNINIINNFKNNPCSICGITYELCNMQIDHINPEEKLYNICNLKNTKEKILLDELKKCQVICALCHRKKSLLEQKEGKYKLNRIKQKPKEILFIDLEKSLKECRICREIKPFNLFSKKLNQITGLGSSCKKCTNNYQKNRGLLTKA